MNKNASDFLKALIRAIATEAASVDGGFLTKTKLLKLVYLLDVEFFRKYGKKLSDLEYIFYKFGPWTPDYEPLLDEMKEGCLIAITSGSRSDLDTQFINSLASLGYEKIFPESEKQWLFREVIRPWLDLPTSRILDYVYFSTEPMITAQKNEQLDFGTIDRGWERYVRKTPRPLHAENVRAMREKVSARLSPQRPTELRLVPEPRLDDTYWDSMEVANADD